MFFLLIGLCLILSYCFKETFYVKNKHRQNPYNLPQSDQYKPFYSEMVHLVDILNNEPYEPVAIQSFDGLTLRGRLYVYDESAPIEITFNGYRTDGVHDSGGIFKLARLLGHNILVVDQRATGDSDGNVISFGINERFDVKSWADYISYRFPKMKILLVGGSLGAASVLMASELDLPVNVVGVIADSAYTSPKAIIKKVIHDKKLNSTIMYPFVKLSARVLGNFKLEDAAPITAVQNTKLPILFIHGKADRYVPCEMGMQNYNACQSSIKKFLQIPNAPHDISLLVDWDRYLQTVKDFLAKIGVEVSLDK